LAIGKPETASAPPAPPVDVADLSSRVTPAQELGVWALCVLIASLLPILSAMAEGSVQSKSPGIVGILSRGDLYLIGAVITIGGIGDLGLSLIKRSDKSKKIVALYVLFPGVVLAAYEGILYSQVATQLLAGRTVAHVGQVALLSFIAFLASGILSGVGVYMAAGD
jgi:hypothetical protein